MPAEDLFALLRTVTVARILVREDFAKRYAERVPISLLETVYPLLQGYDSVATCADVELGGTDQTFNLLLGRDIQTAYGKPEQTIMTLPLLVGTDGEKKMSKSAGNYVGVTDAPADMYGKTMSLPDHAMPQWYRLLLDRDVPDDEPPREAKRALARGIVGRFHGAEAAQEAEAAFDRVFVAREAPAEMPSVAFAAPEGSVHVPALVVAAFGGSSSEARRLVGQGAVKVDGDRVEALDVPAEAVDGRVLQVGKRRFARVAVEG
jgi:tyrosyl-tRNA synthetase